MRLSHAALLMLTMNTSLNALAEPPARAAAPIQAGSLIVHGTMFGPVSEVVLESQSSRSLVLRSGAGAWESNQNLSGEFSSARIYPPLTNPYALVLVPARLSNDGRTIVGFESHAAAYTNLDALGNRYIITGRGQIFGIGRHMNQNVLAEDGMSDHLSDNIPVRNGQTAQEAINEHNALAAKLGFESVIDENIKIDRSKELEFVDYAKARAEADAAEGTLAPKADAGDKRAARAERAARGAGERPRVEEAVRKGKDVR